MTGNRISIGFNSAAGSVNSRSIITVMESSRSDRQEAHIISSRYGMGDPLASRIEEAGRTAEGEGITHP